MKFLNIYSPGGSLDSIVCYFFSCDALMPKITFVLILLNSKISIHKNILNHHYLIKSVLEQHVYFEVNTTL